MAKTATQVTLEDLRFLLSDLPMSSLTRHWVDEHLNDLDKDAKVGQLSEERAQEAEELESEVEDLIWRLRSVRRY